MKFRLINACLSFLLCVEFFLMFCVGIGFAVEVEVSVRGKLPNPDPDKVDMRITGHDSIILTPGNPEVPGTNQVESSPIVVQNCGSCPTEVALGQFTGGRDGQQILDLSEVFGGLPGIALGVNLPDGRTFWNCRRGGWYDHQNLTEHRGKVVLAILNPGETAFFSIVCASCSDGSGDAVRAALGLEFNLPEDRTDPKQEIGGGGVTPCSTALESDQSEGSENTKVENGSEDVVKNEDEEVEGEGPAVLVADLANEESVNEESEGKKPVIVPPDSLPAVFEPCSGGAEPATRGMDPVLPLFGATLLSTSIARLGPDAPVLFNHEDLPGDVSFVGAAVPSREVSAVPPTEASPTPALLPPDATTGGLSKSSDSAHSDPAEIKADQVHNDVWDALGDGRSWDEISTGSVGM